MFYSLWPSTHISILRQALYALHNPSHRQEVFHLKQLHAAVAFTLQTRANMQENVILLFQFLHS